MAVAEHVPAEVDIRARSPQGVVVEEVEAIADTAEGAS